MNAVVIEAGDQGWEGTRCHEPCNEWMILGWPFKSFFDGTERFAVDSKRVDYHLDLIERYYGGGPYAWLMKPSKKIRDLRKKVARGDTTSLTPSELFFLVEHFPGEWTLRQRTVTKETVRTMHFNDDKVDVSIRGLEKLYRALEDANEAYSEGDLRIVDGELVGKNRYRKIVEQCGLKFQED